MTTTFSSSYRNPPPTDELPFPCCPIQRLLIFHLDLPRKCHAKTLGESASSQEQQVQIFYYFHDQQEHEQHQHVSFLEDDVHQEAVDFMGLCMALYTLPSAFVSKDSETIHAETETTQQIYFGRSTLVFVLLETNILGVVQIARLFPSPGTSSSASDTGSEAGAGGNGGHPEAIRKSMQQCHELFALFHHGGIQNRIKNSISDISVLYQYLRELRKAREQWQKTTRRRTTETDLKKEMDSDKDSSAQLLMTKISELQAKVHELDKRLPLSTIQQELEAHYKEYLAHQGLVMSRNGGALRCLVDSLPEPPCFDATSSSPLPFVSTTILKERIKRLLQHSELNFLQGIATFYENQCLNVQWSSSNTSSQDEDSPDGMQQKQQLNAFRTLMRYISSYKLKMSRHNCTLSFLQDGDTNTKKIMSSRNDFGLKQMMFSLNNDGTTSDTAMPKHAIKKKHQEGSFLPPPPPMMLHATENASFVELPNSEQHVWVLNIHLPICNDNLAIINTTHEEFQVVMYQIDALAFLLLCKSQTLVGDEDNRNVASWLEKVEMSLQDIVHSTIYHATTIEEEKGTTTPPFMAGPGQDVVVVDRDENQVYLFSDRKYHPSKHQHQHKHHSALVKYKHQGRFLGFGGRRGGKTTPSSIAEMERGGKSGRNPVPQEWASLGLDSRHLLASHLHLDVLLAFDDMMNEIATRKQAQQQQDLSTNNSQPTTMTRNFMELCTCMPLGWVYACESEGMEIYAFFDSSIYVTVADVQSAAVKIQEHYFGERRRRRHRELC